MRSCMVERFIPKRIAAIDRRIVFEQDLRHLGIAEARREIPLHTRHRDTARINN